VHQGDMALPNAAHQYLKAPDRADLGQPGQPARGLAMGGLIAALCPPTWTHRQRAVPTSTEPATSPLQL
jgi:hypothetical protein